MKIATRLISNKKQAGLTLIELIASLSILALVIGGALSLYGSASTSQSATQTTAELSALRAATKGAYQGQGTYGAAGTNLNSVLVNGKKVPSTINVTAGAPPVFTNSFTGDVQVLASAVPANFTVNVTAVPTEICLGLLSGANGWNSIKVAALAANTTFPIPTATASTECATAPLQTIVFQSN